MPNRQPQFSQRRLDGLAVADHQHHRLLLNVGLDNPMHVGQRHAFHLRCVGAVVVERQAEYYDLGQLLQHL